MDDVVLTICIPTYNRVNKLLSLINNLLDYQEYDIEIVVLDNFSNDNTIHELAKIKDRRLVVIQNPSNIGSMPNIIRSLSFGKGDFLLLCLDKDFISNNFLKLFVDKLKTCNQVSVGCVELNCPTIKDDLNYEKGFSSLSSMAYKSEHPSGLFVNRNVLLENNILEKIKSKDKSFPFNPDLIKAELALKGNAKIVRIPLLKTETLEDCNNEPSHTYTDHNIYFAPNKIIERLNIFTNHILTLDISSKFKNLLIEDNYYKYLYASTIEYKDILKNEYICNHHKILKRNIPILELLRITFNYSVNFYNHKELKSTFWKLKIMLLSNSKIFIKILSAN